MGEPFAEFSLLLIIAAAAGLVASRLQQPVIIAYIVVGILVGPAGFSLVQAQDQIALLSQVGVAMLLFLVGLKLDLHHVRHIGPVALATGLGQLAFTIFFGFLLVLVLGKDWLTALYVAIALTFSSTIIIIKLLSDKRELDSLHGRIAVGFLIVQDLAVVLAMMGMSALNGADAEGAQVSDVLGALLLRITLVAVAMFILMRHVLPPLMRGMARSQEVMLIFALAWGTALAALGEWSGFSKEAGAFLAGFSLASSPYRDAMGARLAGIRDFLLLFFFIELGAHFDFSMLGAEWLSALVLSVFVLVGNPLIVMAIMGYMGYRKRTGFMAGLTVAQISEFSIVFVAMGITLGHIGPDALGLTTLVGIVTIALSTYMILYSQTLYEKLSPLLGMFERKHPAREMQEEVQREAQLHPQVIVFGLGRYGAHLLQRLRAQDIRALGVDFDPELLRELRHQGLQVRFGDVEDPAFVETLPLAQAQWVLTTLPTWDANRCLLHTLQTSAPHVRIGSVVRDDIHDVAMREAGVEWVITPYRDAAEHAADRLVQAISATSLDLAHGGQAPNA